MTSILLMIVLILLVLYVAKAWQLSVMKRDMQQTLATKKNFLSLVSHELRTPLTSAHLSIQMLERDAHGMLQGRQLKLLDRAGISMRALVDLVESLFEYSRIETSRLSLRLERIQASALIREVVEQLAAQAAEKGLAINFTGESDLGTIECDQRLLRIVASNLIANAIKFTSQGEVRVKAARAGSRFLLTVEDTGPGIASADRERIFEPFEQLGHASNRSRPGLGLGLTLVRDIVIALKGVIDVDSDLGRGTKFTVSLPAGAAATARGHGPLAIAREEQQSGNPDQDADEVVTFPPKMFG
jgi:signal transduction histidine kinase